LGRRRTLRRAAGGREPLEIGARHSHRGCLGGKVQPVRIALVYRSPALLHQARSAAVGDSGELHIRLRLRQCRLHLGKLRARLGQLLIELRGRDHGQHVAGMHAAADIDIAPSDVAGRAGKESGAVEGLNRPRQIDLQRSIIGRHNRDAHHRHGRPRRIESRNGCSGAVGMLPGTFADQQAQTRQSAQPEQPCHRGIRIPTHRHI
jgi:hypothetical protein